MPGTGRRKNERGETALVEEHADGIRVVHSRLPESRSGINEGSLSEQQIACALLSKCAQL
jgi:hypothetical protein